MPSTMSTSPASSSPTSPAFLTPETLEADLLAHLASTSALDDLHASLLCSLQRIGWTEKIRRLAVELLRAGRCERFDEVVDAVVALAEGRKHPALLDRTTNNNNNNNNNNMSTYEEDADDSFFENVDVRVPQTVVDQGVRAIKDSLREIVVLEDDADHPPPPFPALNPRDSLDNGTGSSDSKTKKHLKNGDAGASPAKKGEKKAKAGKNVK
ncbi:hypothetical protein ASPZODRAFT_134329 [Penicilliopsis zonata CBS 506.65]|uniref:Uncharacterized protein n=1 Tax=Penicilliopsis zonata CBS 506.65 TaxID=1073090 RepID=A0A1L9SCT8_9EURO|nr:hypothetical protein ASPZODRAFT_134329 [Penicilliopsis zonata CBS 506.65]OJJ44907.1 hypothetical protein ASPZODRAFT_134329 [Penicilliopsis zonata CBS 506.65]